MISDASGAGLLISHSRRLHGLAIANAVAEFANVRVLGLASDAETTWAGIAQTNPDIVLLDLDLGFDELSELVDEIHQRSEIASVLVTSRRSDVEAVADAFAVGADGVILPWSSVQDVAAAIASLTRGDVALPPLMSRAVVRLLASRSRSGADGMRTFLTLTNRERLILQLLGSGRSNNEIAEALEISPQTARTHVQNLLRKLGVHSRVEAAGMAARYGWLVSPEAPPEEVAP